MQKQENKTNPERPGFEIQVFVCVRVTWLARPYRGDTSTLFFLIFPLLLTNPEKNGGNSVTLATNSAYVLREAADGGGKEKERRVWGVKKKLVQVHTVLTHILNSLVAVPSSITPQKFSFIQAFSCIFPSSFLPPFPLLGQAPGFFFCGHVWGLFKPNTTCFLWRPPWALSNLSTVVLSLLLSASYLFAAGCLFSYRLFYRGYEWALSLPCSALNIDPSVL